MYPEEEFDIFVTSGPFSPWTGYHPTAEKRVRNVAEMGSNLGIYQLHLRDLGKLPVMSRSH